MPDGCAASYQSITEQLREVALPQMPSAVCAFDSKETECLARLGDAFDAVEFVVNAVGRPGLVRHVLKILEEVACPAVEMLQNLDPSKLAAFLSGALHVVTQLSAYPMLSPLLPKIPEVCQSELEAVEQATVEAKDVVKVACALSSKARTCLSELSFHLEDLAWVNNMLPNASSIVGQVLELAPVVCGIISGEVGVDVGLSQLPSAITLLHDLGTVDVLSSVLPTVSTQCFARFHVLAEDIAGLRRDPVEIPHRLCGMSNGTKLCMLQVVRGIDAFPDALAEELLQVLPEACRLFAALSQASSTDAFLVHLADIFHILVDLSRMPMLSTYLPRISPSCTVSLSALLSNSSRMNTLLPNPPGFVCSLELHETHCLQEILSDTVKISPVQAALPNAGAAVDQLFIALPHACAVLRAMEQQADAGELILEAIPEILRLMNDLANVQLLSSFVPQMPAGCVDIVDSSLRRGFSSGSLVNGTCTVVHLQPFQQCCVEFAHSLDALSLLPSLLDLDIPAVTLINLALLLLQQVCRQVGVQRLEEVFHDPSSLLKLLPQFLDAYVSVQAEFPHFLPPFNTTYCSGIRSFLSRDLEPVGLVCEMEAQQVSCLKHIVNTLERLPYLGKLLGRPGLVQELIDALLRSICDVLHSKSMKLQASIESLLNHFDLILEAVQHLHGLAPGMVANYLPRIPSGCDVELAQLARLALQPFELCALSPKHFRCFSQLGDNIERVPAVRDMLWQGEEGEGPGILRLASELLNRSICPAFAGLSDPNMTRLLAELPRLFTLVHELRSYPFLRTFLPAVGAQCVAEFDHLASRLRVNAYKKVLCSLGNRVDLCLRGFGRGLANLTHSGVAGVVEGLLDLVPQICSLGIGLQVFPHVLDLYGKVEDVLSVYKVPSRMSALCQETLVEYAKSLADPAAVLPFSICEALHPQTAPCIFELGESVEALPLVGGAVPKGLVKGVGEVIGNGTLCGMLRHVAQMDYNGFVLALPLAMQTLSQLEPIPLLSEFVPIVSHSCKHLLSTSIADKISEVLTADPSHQGPVGLDLSPLTALLCGYTPAEEDCLRELALSVAAVPALEELFEQWTGQGLEGAVAAALDVKQHLCTVLHFLGDREDWSGILALLPHILRLIDGLSRLPAANAYVPPTPKSCRGVLKDPHPPLLDTLEAVCDVKQGLVHCAVDVARALDNVAEVRRMFWFVSGSAAPISQHVSTLLLEDLPNACILAEEITRQIDDGRLEDTLPAVTTLLIRLRRTPIVGSFISSASPGCQAFLSSYTSPIAFCAMPLSARACLIESETLLRKARLLPVSLPPALLDTFFSLLTPRACSMLGGSQVNLTRFIEQDLVHALVVVGNVSGVEAPCMAEAEAAMAQGHAWAICEVSASCRSAFVVHARRMPLLTELVQDAIVDAIDAFCNAVTGITPLQSLAASAVPVALALAGDGCEARAHEVQDLCSIGDECMQSLETRLAAVPGQLSGSLAALLRATCDFAGGGEIMGLLPQVMDVVGGLFRSSCAEEFKKVGEEMAGDASIDRLCGAVRYACVHQLVGALRKLPFLEKHLPVGTEELVASACAVANNRERWAVLQEHLPVMFKLVQSFAREAVPAQACHGKVDRLLFDRYGNFHPNYLCALRPACQQALVRGLQALPMLEKNLPPTLLNLLEQMCVIYRRVPTGRLPLKLLPEFLPQILRELGPLMSAEERCIAAFKEADSLCADLPSDCMRVVVERVQELPLVGRLLPKRSGEVVKVVCSQQSLQEALVDLMAIIGDIMPLDEGCADAFASAALRFRLRGSLDADIFCSQIPPLCVQSAAAQVMKLPLVHKVLPKNLPLLLTSVCSVTSTNSTLSAYVRTQGKTLLKLSSLMVGLSPGCHDAIWQLSDLRHICSVHPSCISSFAQQLRALPFISTRSPEAALHLLHAFCRVKLGADLQEVTAHVLPEIIAASAQQLQPQCVHQVGRVAELSAAAGSLDTASLCEVDGPCLDELLREMLHLPLIGDLLPSAAGQAVGEGCSVLAADGLGEIFAKHMGPIAALVGQVVLDPEDSCANISSQSAKNLTSFCAALLEECVGKLIEGYRSIPVVTETVDARLDVLLDVGCGIVRDGKELQPQRFDGSFKLVAREETPEGCEGMVNATVQELACELPPECLQFFSASLFHVPLLGEELAKRSNVSAFTERLQAVRCTAERANGLPVWAWAVGTGLGVLASGICLMLLLRRKKGKPTKATSKKKKSLVKPRKETAREVAVVPRMVDIDFK